MFFKKFQKLILVLMLTMPMILLFAVPSVLVYADSATMEFVVDDDMISVGDIFTVEVLVSASSVIGQVNLNVVYDDTLIAYNNGPDCVTQEGNVLTIQDTGAGASNGEKVYVLYFDAIASGSAYMKTAASPEVYTYDGTELTVAVKTTTVSVRANDILSDDNSLNGLILRDSAGNLVALTPSFNSDIQEYAAQVGNDIIKCQVTADPSDINATIAVDGQSVLQVGSNDVKITVTAEDGSHRIYTIHVTRLGEKESTPEPTAVAVTPTPVTIELEPEEGITAENTGYGTFLTEYHTYLVAVTTKGLEIPDGYAETSVLIDGNAVTAYAKAKEDPLRVLIALSDEDGNVALYKYDRTEQTLQKLGDDDITYEVIDVNYDEEVMTALKSEENKVILLAAAAAVAAALAVVLLIMNIIKKYRIKNLEDELSKSDRPAGRKPAGRHTKSSKK